MRLKYALSEIDLRTGSDDLGLLSVSIHEGVVPRQDFANDDGRASDVSAYKRCRPGDIIVNRMRAFQGALGVSPVDGLVSPDYAVLRVTALHDARYIAHLLRSRWGVGEMSARLRGIGGSGANGAVRTPRVNVADLGNIDARLPRRDLQRAIADFLDRECARIDELGRQLDELTATARESLRDGVDAWLDEHVARHGRAKLGWYADVIPGFAFESDGFVGPESDGSVRLLRGVNVAVGSIRWDDVVAWDRGHAALATWALREGDVVLGMDRPWINRGLRVATIAARDLPAYLVQRVACIRPRDVRLTGEYARLWLERDLFRHELSHSMTGVAVPHISGGQIEAYRVAIPSTGEQRRVVHEMARRREHGMAVEQEVAGLRDALATYRDAVITEAVTGHLDVTRASDAQMDERLHEAVEVA